MLSLDQLVRVEQALWALGKEQEPERLKTLLTPLIARNPQQQQEVHEVFDQWMSAHVYKEEETPPEPEPEPKILVRARRAWLLPLMIFLGLASISALLWILWPQPAPVKPGVYFGVETPCLQVGQAFAPKQETVFIDTSLARVWEFGDGQKDSAFSPSHVYKQAGLYEVSLTVFGEGIDSTYRDTVKVVENPVPVAKIQQSESGLRYRFQADSTHPSWEYLWLLNGDTVSREFSFEGSLSSGQEYTARLVVSLAEDEQGVCTAEASQRVDLKEQLVDLPMLEPLRSEQSNPIQWTLLAYLSIGLMALLIGGGWVLGRNMWWKYRQRPPETDSFSRAFAPAKGPPVELSFPSMDHLITGGESLRTLATALRQREHSERQFLDVQATLKATIANAGLPEVQFAQLDRPIEYLVLVETQGEEDQQARLFQRLLRILQDEQVPLEVWYYQGIPGRCFQHGSDKEVSLGRLAQVYGGHRLIIFGKGDSWLNPLKPGLRPDLQAILQRWQNRALLSPVPVTDWGFREEMLHQQMILLPADLLGQEELLSAWNDRDPKKFEELRLHLLQQRSGEDLWFLMDAQDIDELRENLRPRRFAWLAAAAIYPRPIWELTVAMGSLFGDMAMAQVESLSMPGVEIHYEDLLTITRMPWLQSGDLPEHLRETLIEQLTEEEKQRARELLVLLLEAADPPPQSYAAREKEIQLAVNQAMLAPADEQQQAGLQLLLEQGLLDPMMRKETKARKETFSWTRELIIGGLTAVMLLLMGIPFLEGNPPSSHLWKFTVQPIDSLRYYLNRSADAIDAGNYGLLSDHLDRLKEYEAYPFQSNYQRALFAYREAKLDYELQGPELQEMVNASFGFQQVRDLLATPELPEGVTAEEAMDSLTSRYRRKLGQHLIHAEGLTLVYLNDLDRAAELRQQLPDSFFLAFGEPNLASLLGERVVDDRLILHARLLDAKTRRPVENALLLVADGPDLRADALGRVYYQYPEPPQTATPGHINLTVKTDGYQEEGHLFTLHRDSLQVDDILLQPLPAQPVTVEVSQTTGCVPLEVTCTLKSERKIASSKWLGMENVAEIGRGEGVRTYLFEEQGTFKLVIALTYEDGETDTLTNIPAVRAYDRPAIGIEAAPSDIGPLSYNIFTTTTQDSITYTWTIEDQTYRTSNLRHTFSTPGTYVVRLQVEGRCGITTVEEEVVVEVPLPQSAKFLPPTMVSIPGGTFTMGNVMGDEGDPDETPHEVSLRSFEMAATELSFAEYDLFCEATKRELPSDAGWGRGERPVIYVDWYDALEYCNWLSEQMGYQPVYGIDKETRDPNNTSVSDDKQWTITADWSANGFRLPTEAEWEYAARQAGQTVRFGNGRDTADTDEINFDGMTYPNESYSFRGEYREKTLPVRSLRPNSLGLYHMSGNVYEWCWDWHGRYPLRSQRNPYGPLSGDHRVIRGGNWDYGSESCRVANRHIHHPDNGNRIIGFRLTRTP